MLLLTRDLARLATHAANQTYQNTHQAPARSQIPEWGVAVLAITFLSYVLVILAVSYPHFWSSETLETL